MGRLSKSACLAVNKVCSVAVFTHKLCRGPSQGAGGQSGGPRRLAALALLLAIIAATFFGTGAARADFVGPGERASAPPKFRQPDGAAITRTMLSKLRDVLNAADFGVKCDGVTDDAASLNAAIADANARNPGGQVLINAGTCMVGSTVVLLSNVALVGSGVGATTIKLKNGVNNDVIDGLNAQSLFGTASNSGVSFASISDMTIDGNKANQSTGGTACVAIYGWRFNLTNLRIQNCFLNGMRTEYGGNAIDLTANFLNILIDTTGNHGWWFNGPHDSNADAVIIVDAGQATNNTWDGILLDTLSNIHGRNLHPYHRSTSTNRMKFALEDNSLGGSNISDSNFEGANIPAQINSSKNTYINDSFYAAWGGVSTLIIKQPENVVVGFLGDPGSGRAAVSGVVLGTGSDNASVNIVDLVASAQTLGAVDFTHSAGNNQVRIKGFAGTGPGYIGTPATGDNVEIDISGTPTSLPHLIQKPGKVSSGSLGTPVLTSCGSGSAITGTDYAGIIGTGSGATGCTLTFAVAYANAPFCVIGSQQNASTPAYTRNASTLVLSTGTAASSFYHYICVGQPGG